MGIVLRGTDKRTGLPVAIKVMSKTLQDPELQARFMKENEILASLNHRNIVRCHEITRTKDGLPSIVMEYLRAVDFTAFETKPYPELLPLMIQAAMGLDYLKGRNVLHRDLSSNNILVVLEHERRSVKIVDFGVAKVLGESTGEGAELTRTGQFFGKFAFASPELLLLEPVDWRSDIYSLGVIFFRLLMGRRPLKITHPMNYMEWIQAHQKEREYDFAVAEGRPELPGDMRDLLTRMLSRPREERPQQYGEIIEILDRAQKKAAAAGLEPDAATLSSLPPPPGKTGVSGGGSAPSGSGGSAPGSGPKSTPVSDSEPTMDGTPAGVKAPPDLAVHRPDWLHVQSTLDKQTPVGARPPEEESVFVSSQDFFSEMQQLSGKKLEGVAPHPMRGPREPGPPPSSRTARHTAPSTRTSPHTAPGATVRRRKPGASKGAKAAAGVVLFLAVAGGLAWFLLAGPGRQMVTGGDAAAIAPAGDGSKIDFSSPAVKPSPAPETPRDLGPAARHLTAENVRGFSVTTINASANVLLRFSDPVNLTGVGRAQITRARTRDGAAVQGIEGAVVELAAGPDPGSTQMVRFTVAGDFELRDPRLAALDVLEIQMGTATLLVRRLKEL